tara:strand:+ start:702 stop:1130 length:429 start_codon:yes stop_codon:yes gene_type:complete
MSTIEKAIKSPVFVTLRGSQYEFVQLGLSDWAGFCEHLKNERRKEINKAELPNSEKRILYSEWIKTPLDIDAMLNEAMTFTGLSWLLWRSISGNHKEITQSSVMDLFDGITDATEILGQIIGMPDEEEDEGEDELGNEPTNL